MDTNIKKIRALNDNLRQNFTAGRVLITRGVAELPIDKQLNIIEKVREKHKMEIEERRILKSKRTQLANNLDILLDMRLNNSITQEQYNKKYNDITKQIETTDTKLTRYNEITKQGLNTLEDLILLVSKIPDIYKNSNMQEKRKVLKLLYSNLFLQGKKTLFSIRKPLENILSGGFRHVWSGL